MVGHYCHSTCTWAAVPATSSVELWIIYLSNRQYAFLLTGLNINFTKSFCSLYIFLPLFHWFLPDGFISYRNPMFFAMMAGNAICPRSRDFQLKRVLVTFCTASLLGIFEHWNIGTFERLNIGAFKHVNTLKESIGYLLYSQPVKNKLFVTYDKKITGGTPEVGSDKSLTLVTFDIWYLTFESFNIWTF